MAEGYGYGKVILFGEHFVVYGIPAIASAVGDKTIAAVEAGEPGTGLTIVDNRLATPGYKDEKREEQQESLNFIFKAVGVDVEKTPLKITLGGSLIAASGIGASAASCAAIARGISGLFNYNYSNERVNEIAYEGERGYHGTPSGIDNTAATYGGLIWFIKGQPPVMERLTIRQPVEIVIGNTGLTASTTEVVADVRKSKENDPETYDPLFERAKELAAEGRKAFEAYDLEAIGRLMDENHTLLQKIGVSCHELDRLVGIAKEQGALGAKLTGTGRGGNMIALTPGKELQERVAAAIEKAGFTVMKTIVGV